MSQNINAQTLEVLTNEIEALQSQCKDHCDMISNAAPMEIRTINSTNCDYKKLNYSNSLTKNLQNDETPIITDSNINTSLFLSEITEKIRHVEELTAFTRGALQDVENENKRLRSNIEKVQAAKARPWSGRREVRPEHLQQAKQRFKAMKAELHGLIHSLFPGANETMMDIMGELMRAKMNETSTGYIPLTPENYHLIELLKDKNIVTAHPYNRMEVKLAF